LTLQTNIVLTINLGSVREAWQTASFECTFEQFMGQIATLAGRLFPLLGPLCRQFSSKRHSLGRSSKNWSPGLRLHEQLL